MKKSRLIILLILIYQFSISSGLSSVLCPGHLACQTLHETQAASVSDSGFYPEQHGNDHFHHSDGQHVPAHCSCRCPAGHGQTPLNVIYPVVSNSAHNLFASKHFPDSGALQFQQDPEMGSCHEFSGLPHSGTNQHLLTPRSVVLLI